MPHLDNAASSHPKPRTVAESVLAAIETLSGSPGRGNGPAARAAAALLEDARRDVAVFLGAPDASRLAFTLNATDSLNLALRSLVPRGGRVVTTPVEHAAVTRPLARLGMTADVRIDFVPLGPDGRFAPADVAAAAAGADLVVLTAASNVTGAGQPVEETARLLARLRVPLLVDAAQAAGPLPLAFEALGPFAVLAATGHKALLGPMGAGVVVVGSNIELAPWREGGTGDSRGDLHPEDMPQRLEGGTPPLPAIAGLAAGVRWWRDGGVARIRKSVHDLAAHAAAGLAGIPGVRIPDGARWDDGPRVPLLAFRVDGYSVEEAALLLETELGVVTRAGLHCAPDAHRWLGTWPEGTLRASLGPTTSEDDVEALLAGVRSLAAAPPA